MTLCALTFSNTSFIEEALKYLLQKTTIRLNIILQSTNDTLIYAATKP